MTMEMLNELMNAMVKGTLAGICLGFWFMGLTAIWKWFIGVVKRFLHWLFPKHFAPKNVTENKK